MKRIMTVFLSALIVLCSLTCVFIAPVSAATNLWSSISADDWYTRQVQTEVSDPLTLTEKKLTDVYPEKFTYGGGSFSLENANGKYIYVKMPALSTNKEYTLSFNYSVTSSSGTPNLYKAIIMPKSAFTNQYCWNGFGAMMSGRGFLGAYDIFVNKALASTELSGTVTYTFNSKTQSEYYLFLTFNNIDTVTYSNFKVVDPTDTTPEPEENPAELWTNMSADDWHTKHIQGSATYDDGRDIPEKTVAERYGSDFSFDTESKSFNLKNASGRHYYVKMPILAKNKEYTLSFDYNVVANGTPKIDKILLVPKDAFTHALCWQNTTGQIFTNRTNIGIKDMFVGVSIADKTSDTLTYEFNTGNYTEYYVFLKFSGISEITLSKFSVIDPDLVVDDEPETSWKAVDASVTITPEQDSEKGSIVKIGTPWYKGVYYKLTQVEKNTDYVLTFNYKAKPYTENGTITKLKLATEDGFNNAVCWSGGEPLNGDMVNDRAQYGVTDIENDITVDNTWTKFTYEFNSGNTTQFYFYIRTAHILELALTNITVEIAPEKPEIPDEIPPYSTDATNIWTEYSIDDWYTKQVVSGYSDGREIPEKSASEVYGEDFAYDEATKSFSLKNAGGRYYYVKLPVLEKNKNYFLGFDYITTLNKNKNGKFNKAILVPKDQFNHEHCWNIRGEVWSDRHFIDLKDIVGGKDDGLAPGGIEITEENRKGNIDFIFNSGRYTEYYLFLMFNDVKTVTYHNLEVSTPVSLDVVAGLGGTVTSTKRGLVVGGTEVTVTASPDKGNNFKHWLDKDGLVVSSDAEYTFTLEEDTYLKAVFGGYNKPSRELFALRGDDGTFENGTISGIYAASDVYPTSLGHCKTSISTAYAYEGEKSLEVVSYYRNTVIPLTGLNKNTDYRFAFYVKYPYNGDQEDWNHISSMMICGADDVDTSTADKIFAEYSTYLAGDAGWYKVELYFNSGDNTAANFLIYYGGEPQLAPKVYMDNITLYEYYSANELLNGSMTDDIAPWLGDGEIENNTLKLSGKNTTAYQLLGLDAHSRYTIKFRAKGNIFASASNVTAKVPDIYNAISSESYVEGNSSGFKNYSFEVYTGVHKGTAIMFSSLGGDAFIDDVTVTKELSAIGGVIENVDFETDRFALTHTNKDAYEIYTAKSNKDDNVHSGKKSLHFKYNSKNDVEQILDEAYLSYGVALNHNYMLSLYYKFDSDTKEAAVNLEPNYRATYFNGDYGDYTGEIGYKQPSTKGEWKRINFVFTARDFGVLKAAIYNIVGSTDNGFYVDDIVITVASDLVVDENAEKAYTTDFYNMFTNPSFEKPLSSGNWVGLPKTAEIVKNPNLSDTADSFLKVSEGTKYILPISLNPSEIYYFGASIKSFNGGKGRIYLATLVEPTTLYFTDLENNPKSVITADGDEWKHEGFGFRASPTGETYMVIECTEGSIGIDTVSLTPQKHANPMDYNQYYPHIPFDYDNIDPAMIVYNGGFDVGPEGISPSTGDSIKVVSIITFTCVAAAAVMLLTKKRKDESDV